MMKTLSDLYAQMLRMGFIVLRQAIQSGQYEWAEAELELLHNVPGLIGETNIKRHEYFWHSERAAYLEWVSGVGRQEAKSRMLTFYEPIWQEMAPLMAELFAADDEKAKASVGR